MDFLLKTHNKYGRILSIDTSKTCMRSKIRIDEIDNLFDPEYGIAYKTLSSV